MNCVYLMIDEKRNGCAFKVGFTSDMDKRYIQYTTHNAGIQCISRIATYGKSKHNVETMIHAEIAKRVEGWNKRSNHEWFMVSYDDPWYSELCERGLLAFTCTKGRKELGGYGKGDKVLAEGAKKVKEVKPVEMLLPYSVDEVAEKHGCPMDWDPEDWFGWPYEDYMRDCMSKYQVPVNIMEWEDKYY